MFSVEVENLKAQNRAGWVSSISGSKQKSKDSVAQPIDYKFYKSRVPIARHARLRTQSVK